jgi:hypothetical protein
VIDFDVELPVPGKEDLNPSPTRRTLHQDKKYKTDIVRAGQGVIHLQENHNAS